MSTPEVREVRFKNAWKGFAFDRITEKSEEQVKTWQCDHLVVTSGCLTTTQPLQNKDNYDIRLESQPLEMSTRPQTGRRWFLAPIAVSRYEGIRQCGASAWINMDGNVYMHFSRNAVPMVVHLSGFAYCTRRPEDGEELTIPEKGTLKVDEDDRPLAHKWKDLVLLQGCFLDAKNLGSSEKVAVLPEGFRPLREVRCLAPLLVSSDPQAKVTEDQYVGLESIAITVQTDGSIYVQGGYVYNVDKKGHMRKLQQKKRGKVCLDGVRFLVCEGKPVEPAKAVQPKTQIAKESSTLLQKLSGGQAKRSAVCKKLHGNVVVLEGSVDCVKLRNPKLAVAKLPPDCCPPHRLCFFTRDRSEERCRVDIDKWGRIFCPESPGVDGVELSGIIFVASEQGCQEHPRDWDWDELNLQYAPASEETTGLVHKQVDNFIERCNWFEWQRFRNRISDQRMGVRLLLGDLYLRGNRYKDPFNLGNMPNSDFLRRAWRNMEAPLGKQWGIRTPQQLFQLPRKMLERVLDSMDAQNLDPRDRRHFIETSEKYHRAWDVKRQPGMNFKYLQDLATEIADEMFERWDLDAQVKGVLDNDSKPPEALRKFFSSYGKRYKDQEGQKRLSEEDKVKFEEIRQFFYYHETNGNSMTHCSLKGSADTFTNTGKWFFPDSVSIQTELFKNIAWLYERDIFHYISERQTPRFPFIEDFDVQADVDFMETPPGKQRPDPPDWLIMEKPKRDGVGNVFGDPGPLMRQRASCIRKLYSGIDELRCLVYSASGFNKGKDKLKASFHLVWPQLVVDADSAPWIREITLMVFKEESKKPGSFLANVQQQLLDLEKGGAEDKSNEWEMVFDKTTINATNGLRLPYNDKASLKPTDEEKERIKRGEVSKSAAKKIRVIEGRPSKAIGEILFRFEKDEQGNDKMLEAKWVKDVNSQPIAEWIQKGSCRIDANDPDKTILTQLQPTREAIQLFQKYKKNERQVRKEGVRYFWDREQNEFETHAPFKNIKLCDLSVKKFKALWDEHLSGECDALIGSTQEELAKVLDEGRWIFVTETQALWRTSAAAQFALKDPSAIWGQKRREGLKRPAELIYLRYTPPGKDEEIGKVILDGPEEICIILLSVLDLCRCERDDVSIMPLYDVKRMCKY